MTPAASDRPPTEGDPVPSFRRLLFVLDALSESMPGAEIAALLARRFAADLAALYVESEDLARLAGHPGVGFVATRPSAFAPQGTPPSSESGLAGIAETLRAKREEGRRAVEQASHARSVRASFEIHRGRMVAAVAERAVATDLVVVGWSESLTVFDAARRDQPPASAIEDLAARVPGSILFLCEGRSPRDGIDAGPVTVFFDGGAAAGRAVETAAAIAESDGGALTVVLATPRPAEAARWQEEIARHLAATGLRIAFLHLPEGGMDALGAALAALGTRLAVIPAPLPSDAGPITRRLGRRGCSLLLVR